jgi:hypothetical protein
MSILDLSYMYIESELTNAAKHLERRCKDLIIITFRVRIPLCDVGTGPLGETLETEIPCRNRCGMYRNPHC